MAQRGIREYDAKMLMARYLSEFGSGSFAYPGKLVLVDPNTVIDVLPREHPWLETERLVVKPDKLFGKRGKLGPDPSGRDDRRGQGVDTPAHQPEGSRSATNKARSPTS